MWQVSGRSKITDFDEVVRLDTIYIDKWDILLDLKIIFRTAIQMLFKDKDAY
jgi:lipopolysaccharide/colanic/teichoic acid biosynthesis glycosyltransferase